MKSDFEIPCFSFSPNSRYFFIVELYVRIGGPKMPSPYIFGLKGVDFKDF